MELMGSGVSGSLTNIANRGKLWQQWHGTREWLRSWTWRRPQPWQQQWQQLPTSRLWCRARQQQSWQLFVMAKLPSLHEARSHSRTLLAPV
jgi:hypothetical protein